MRGVAMLLTVVVGAQSAAPPELATLETLARDGWQAARAAAASGGTAETLAPARRALESLDAQSEKSSWRLQIVYARSLVAAAMAAAQDERAEMEVHLAHARELADRLTTSRYPAIWPMPVDEAAGELWFEVNEYAEALKAYQRALARKATPGSWLGLARSAARLNDVERACDAYRRVTQLGADEQEAREARDYVAGCR